MLKIGKKLEAINPCKMYTTGEESLIVGKEYEIIDLTIGEEGDECIVIIDKQNTEHLFPINELSKWFKTSNQFRIQFRIFKYKNYKVMPKLNQKELNIITNEVINNIRQIEDNKSKELFEKSLQKLLELCENLF